ncbi:fasciclin domain-containing protein [Salegentibacter sp. HM20]
MDFISKLSKIAVVAFLATGFLACSDDDEAGDIIVPSNSIADFVANNDSYSSLAAALDAAGLTATLDGNTNYTVFAPNNAAFNTFLSANGFASLDEVPVPVLREILLNHVLEGTVMSSSLSNMYVSTMATGMASDENLSMYINVDDGVMINGMAEVTNADIDADNGVIHAVDAVIGLPSIVDFAVANPNFEILVQALTREEDYTFVETLSMTEAPAPFTVFAPTNDAFVALLDELGVASLDDIDSETLATVLTYHVVANANVRSSDLSDGMRVETLQGDSFTVNLGDPVTLTDANGRTAAVVAVDVQANNGVIHALDTVILPEM